VTAMTPSETSAPKKAAKESAEMQAREGHIVIKENLKGVSFEKIFGPWIKGATKITITDPYIRLFHQARNLMEFMELVSLAGRFQEHRAVKQFEVTYLRI